MLSSAISCISYYLKTSCFRPKPLQKHQQPPWRKRCFSLSQHRSYQKSKKIDQNERLEKHIQKNTRNLNFLTILASQTLPKTPPKPSQIEPKRPLGRLLDPLGPSWQQSLNKKRLKSAPRDAKEVPNPSQNLPKTLPKPLENPLKNACEKYMVLGSVFFKIFSNFGFQNHLFFNEFLMHASIQISLIFGTLSPSQSISFGRMFDTF